ncbi:MAG: bifunctional 2-C-methyl-D-erythritol 4-phosphate cytidylyltransferase/2-C-methyl-D-erythritol 2,4-cyclodiphosphate synthase [Rhizobiaceae bacterium]
MKTNEKSAGLTGAVIVAAGRGHRAGQGDGPKQYQLLGARTVLYRSLQPFLAHPSVAWIVVVIHPDDQQLYKNAVEVHDKLLAPVFGGATRQQSVAAGLQALAQMELKNVLIHDAARPFIDTDTINRVVSKLDTQAAVLPSLPVADTLKRCAEDGVIVETVDRSGLYSAQTPQGFHFSAIWQAHQKAKAETRTDFSDDTGLAEWVGMQVTVVDGDPRNVKITSAQDMAQAQEKFAMPVPDVRVGHGYDTHQFIDGDYIWLCGVKLPHDKSLSGHSDADVGLHALTDALLAAVADGDIGSHFPPSDPQWRGASSDRFLAHAVKRVAAHGGRITHMDVTLVCEAPKIGPHRDVMREAISKISGIEAGRISVKATTNEKIGFVGRNEGMVALATATVVMETY